MPYYSGRDGSLLVGNTTIGRVQNWSITANVDALETTDLGDNARSYTPGVKSATGSATFFYHTDTPATLLAPVIQTGAVVDSDDVALDLRWGTGNNLRRIQATVLITSAEISVQTGEVMSATINFTVTGDYTTITLS